jgi:hypothetical protein
MRLNVKNTAGKRVKIYDFTGVEITGVKSFDTKTGDMVLFLIGNRDGSSLKEYPLRSKIRSKCFRARVVTVKVKIKGAYAIVDGQKITNKEK